MPDFNFFDYVIGYDDIKFNDRYIRRTALYYSFPYLWEKSLSSKDVKELLYNKKYFCNFIYSHGNGITERDLIFEELSKYKFVHALGKHKKNCDIEIGPRSGNFVQTSIEAKNHLNFL